MSDLNYEQVLSWLENQKPSILGSLCEDLASKWDLTNELDTDHLYTIYLHSASDIPYDRPNVITPLAYLLHTTPSDLSTDLKNSYNKCKLPLQFNFDSLTETLDLLNTHDIKYSYEKM